MEKEVWPGHWLETFATAYIQHEVLYTKVPSRTHKALYDRLRCLELNKEFALERLSRTLSLPNDHALRELCREFRYQLLSYVRGRVRTSATRGEHWASSMKDTPKYISELVQKMQLLRVAVQAELSWHGGPVRRWALHTLKLELALGARVYFRKYNTKPQHLTPCVLSSASAAVWTNAEPVPKHIWIRLCEVKKLQLQKLSHVGDRSDQLWASERLDAADWELVDTLLLYCADNSMSLVTETAPPAERKRYPSPKDICYTVTNALPAIYNMRPRDSLR